MTQNITHNKSFLQSPEWADFQRSLGRDVMHIGDTYVINMPTWLGKSYFYIPHGPSDVSGDFFEKIKKEAIAKKAIFILAEPREEKTADVLSSHDFRFSTRTIQPTQTIVLDLSKEEADLSRRLHSKMRYNIHLAEKSGVVVNESDDIEIFLKLLHGTAKRDNFSAHPDEYYRKMFAFFQSRKKMRLYIASYGGQPIAGAIVLLQGDSAYYIHGASDYAQRSRMAPALLHWHIMLDIKKDKYLTYDLWGIDEKRYAGVTRFKRSFGGRELVYPGTYILPIDTVWYVLYRFMRFVKNYV